jgi:hypothetical protein
MPETDYAKISLAQHGESIRPDLCEDVNKGTTGHA